MERLESLSLGASSSRSPNHLGIYQDPYVSSPGVYTLFPISKTVVDPSSVCHNNPYYFHVESGSRSLVHLNTCQDPGVPSPRLLPNPYTLFANSNGTVDPSVNHNNPCCLHDESSSRSPIHPSTYQDPCVPSPRLASNPYALFTNMSSMSGPSVCHNKPCDFHGESSSRSPMHPFSCQGDHVRNPGFVENPDTFDANPTDMSGIGHNHGGYYNMIQNYGSAMCMAQTRKLPKLSSMILCLMTREGRTRLRNLLVKCPRLICAITKDKFVLVEATKDEYDIECIKLLVKVIRTFGDLCEDFTSTLQEDIHDLMLHPNGPDLVWHCLTFLSYSQNQFLFDAASKHNLKLARDKNESECLKECIRVSRQPQQWRIVRRLVVNCVALAGHSQANLVIQEVLKLDEHQFNRDICVLLQNHLEELSKSQHGSYVIQACLRSSRATPMLQCLGELGDGKLEEFAKDRYGNYVIQTAIEMSEGTGVYDRLVSAFRRLHKDLKDDLHARSVLCLIRCFKLNRNCHNDMWRMRMKFMHAMHQGSLELSSQ